VKQDIVYEAKELSEVILDVRGLPKQKVAKIGLIAALYSKPCTHYTGRIYFRDYEEKRKMLGTRFRHMSVGQFIQVCLALHIKVHWTEQGFKTLNQIR
jgi:hypothetical protein